ncbi:copper amine oxidase N-terminal domain-containing protein [Paenibacillus sp. CMAA1364]
MKKVLSILVSCVVVFTVMLQMQVHAAGPIGVYINGVKLSTDQAPILVDNRALLPLRAIFEALDATVYWNQDTKVVTAKRDGDTIILRLGSTTATINNTTVSLDVPAQLVAGRVLVPVRFVSEALGETVDWNSSAQRVSITTTVKLPPVSYIQTKVINQMGNGSDLQVNFPKVLDESAVSQYRIYVVKSSLSSSFNLTTALLNTNYTSVPLQGRDITVTLSAQAKDTSGEWIKSNQSYVVYVLTEGKGATPSVLSNSSSTVHILARPAMEAVTGVLASDVADYGDGRDMLVSFNKVTNETQIGSYRIFIVKANQSNDFNLAKSKSIRSSNYTLVGKKGTNIHQLLTSGTKDTDGAAIKNGVPYRIFVMSVGTGSWAGDDALSASSVLSLGWNMSVSPATNPVISDINDYQDGRDFLISFKRAIEESNIGHYRVMVVKGENAVNFNLAKANAVASANYTYIAKTGNHISQVLSSNAKDVDGAKIKNGVNYRVFILAVGNANDAASNMLSGVSNDIVLSSVETVAPVTGITRVWDEDESTWTVSFDKPANDQLIDFYEVMITTNPKLSLADANKFSVTSAVYRVIYKGDIPGFIINKDSRDVTGTKLKSDEDYYVYILSRAMGTNNNALSLASKRITMER